MKFFSYIIIFFLSLSLLSCTSEQPAQVHDLRNEMAIARGYHTVSMGETLYFIAWRYQFDFKSLAEKNHLSPPYALTLGEKLYFSNAPKHVYTKAPPIKNLSAPILPVYQGKAISQWIFPVKSGVILSRFSRTNKGVDIGGTLGQPVLASAGGEIVYAGNGLRGYGNLILIKHNDLYLSAYAHNQKLLVKEGQIVRAGQAIATLGSTDANQVALHFEIRKQGKPVDPLKLVG